jgi:phage baseplate assembly protein W
VATGRAQAFLGKGVGGRVGDRVAALQDSLRKMMQTAAGGRVMQKARARGGGRGAAALVGQELTAASAQAPLLVAASSQP